MRCNGMLIREYRADDLPRIIEIFEDTVNTVCRADYAPIQISAWLGADYSGWDRRYRESFTLVAVAEGEIVAFGNMVAGAAACGRVCGGHTLGSDDGYLDMLYTAKNYLRRGVASALCKELEKAVRGDIYADVSKTALPFFLARGYEIITPQQVTRRGVKIGNFACVKRRT